MFRAVRLQHILNDVVSVRTVETDKIIPHSEYVIKRPCAEYVVCRLAATAVQRAVAQDVGS